MQGLFGVLGDKDWKKTDTNNDNSISIIELSARLKAQAHTIEKQYPIIRNVGGDVKLREL